MAADPATNDYEGMTTRYDDGMTTRITVDLPDDLVEEARRAVKRGDVASVSVYITEALRNQRPKITPEGFFAEWYAESGPPSAEDYAWAEEQLERIRSKAQR